MKHYSQKRTLKERFNEPTPPFFKKIRNAGIILAAAGGAILAAPVTLGASIPAAILSIGTYLTLAGSVAATVAQAATTKEEF
jgi:hypothetical protein